MKRKINKVGPGTYTISLPKKWVEQQLLKKGDEIDLEEKGSILVVNTSKKPIMKRVKVHVPLYNHTILRTLYHSYRSGAEEVELTFDNKDCIKIVESIIGTLMGFEIIEQTDNSILIKNITEINEKDFEKTFKRLFDITLYMGKKIYENLSSGNFESLSNTAIIEKTQNKIYLFCLRSLNLYREGLKDLPSFYYLLAQRLEDMGDSFKFICGYYAKTHPKKISQETLGFLSEVNNMLSKIYYMHYNFNIEQTEDLFNAHILLKDKLKELLLTQPKEELFLLTKLEKIVVDIYDASSPIFGINFEKMDQKQN